MGQHWKLVNIDKRRELFNHEKLELSGHCQLQLREFLLSTIAEQLVSLLRISKLRPFKVSEDQIHTAKVKSVSSPLIALPQEIIDLVVSVLVSSGSDVDVVCLSLTCSYFFRLLASTNQTIVARNDAPWAGDRLILVGDFAEGIPPGIATDDELQEWKKFGENPFYNLAEAQVGERLPSEMPHWIRKGMVEQAHMLPSFIYQRLAGNGQNLCDRLMRMLYVWDWPPADEVEPGSDSAILRNLTTKEYVLWEKYLPPSYSGLKNPPERKALAAEAYGQVIVSI
ncbi:hypothetical protein QQZ08_002764 [Neonectria magnoliae]|uniref:F-box domain-containing protein n=1 Tax=Neonectria magnoliae TaxID=2732573 RepID=A0ABR1IB73_9HYPO